MRKVVKVKPDMPGLGSRDNPHSEMPVDWKLQVQQQVSLMNLPNQDRLTDDTV